MTHLSVAIAGSTFHTRMCAEALFQSGNYTISHIITPEPKPVGRKQTITKNPLHMWADEHQVPVTLVVRKIDESFRDQLATASRPDMLLVVDFGYIVPNWLLEWPKIAPLNIHPSLLPRWRGSSPGQFALLYGERDSAVTLMVMDEKLDHGSIIAQLPFCVEKNWTQTEYYQKSFELICAQLPELLSAFAEQTNSAIPQPDISPTEIAGRLERSDGFVPWEVLQLALHHSARSLDIEVALSPILQGALVHHGSLVKTLVCATQAFQPWPSVWTLMPTTKGEQRLKILEATEENGNLILKKVQLEGKNPSTWNELKSLL